MHLIIVENLDTDREKLEALILHDCCHHGQKADFSFYKSGEAFLEGYKPGSCDCIFLDILMDGISGMEVAKRIRLAEPRLPIVFTTTEPDYALEGFSVHAMDYLVKPLSADRVAWCLKELREYLAVPSCISLMEILGWGHSSPVIIALDDILYGQHHNHSMDVHTVRGVCRARLSFRDFTALLPHTGRFYICGRGLVVNLSQVERIGDGTLLLKNGENIPFSRSHKSEVQHAFTQWSFACSRKGGWS